MLALVKQFGAQVTKKLSLCQKKKKKKYQHIWQFEWLTEAETEAL